MSIGASLQQLREQLGRVAEDADRERPPLVPRRDARDGVLQRVGLLVEVAVLDPAGDAGLVDVDADRDPAVHRHGQRLGAPMPPSPAVTVSVPASVPPNLLSATAANVS